MKKLTTEEFIEKAVSVHGPKYDYSLVDYKNTSTKVKIICPDHGTFEQIPNSHLQGKGCSECGHINRSKQQLLTIEEFMEKAESVHQDKYDYSLVDYKTNTTKVKIICPDHGAFEQTPGNHLRGKGCPKCAAIKRSENNTFTTEQFIEKTISIHQDKYDYSLVDYKGTNIKVKIICPVHGTFEQRPNAHLQGNGCPKCGHINTTNNLSLTSEEFIEKAISVHGPKYDYSLVDYKNNKTKVKIICKDHGVFEQTPHAHIQGNGCPECADINRSKNKTLTTEEFIEKAISVHQNAYDYSLVDYKNSRTKVKIICPEHGTFEQTPGNHLQGNGCPKCADINASITQKLTTEEFIERATSIHQDKYDYSLVDYKNNATKVKIICPDHGVFEQTPGNHINLKQGCPKCAAIKRSENNTFTTEEFIEKAISVHQDTYDYSLVDYKNSRTKVKIICPVHGTFEQTPDGHFQGQGCPKCVSIISKQEIELQQWLGKHIDIKTNNRSVIKPFELDVVIPEKQIAIEYNGLYWHSEGKGKDRKYHLNKYNLCKYQGYRLIQIWENEWLFKQDIVKSIILNSIGINKRVIHGRKCIIKDVEPKEARVMYDNNHIQGFKGGNHKGLYYKDELVSLMTIDKRNELQRFVNLKYTKVHGAFSKLLKSFVKSGISEIYTFADLRYFTGGVYEGNGFKYNKMVSPRYTYFNHLNVYHRRNFQKKNIEKKYNNGELDYYDENKTEYQNMIDNSYGRIWDSGKIRYNYDIV